MAREAFEDWAPKDDSLRRLQQCVEIVEEYRKQGLRLTLRQLYYQLVARDYIPNTMRSYKNTGTLLNKARLAGFVDWSSIEDRGRRPDLPTEFTDLDELVEAALNSYRLPRWKTQDCYAELWVEKQALAGVLEPMARQYHVPLMVNKGYSSSSAMYESAQRLLHNSDRIDKECHIFYLGDHDPSGEDMVRDVTDRLRLFTREEVLIIVHKIALTTAQIKKYKPPPNPAKIGDSRAKAYIAKHGHHSWEVDALNPSILQKLIRDALEEVIDVEAMDKIKEQEIRDKALLKEALHKLRSR